MLPPQLCARSAFSIVSGGLATVLCSVAIIIHMSTRHSANNLVTTNSTTQQHYDHFVAILKNPLRVEFVLSAVLSTLLGLNAVFCTGVQGPGASVGNLYYASWISFLLCLRILLGCMEETYNLGKEHHHDHADCDESAASESVPNKSVSTDAASTIMSPDLFDNDRARSSRRYLFLGIVSTICSASALDAVST